jgi:hypothetical protein
MTDNYRPPSPSWDRQTWDAAVASDLGSHIGAEQLNQWSRVFDLIPKLNLLTAKEADEIGSLTIGVVGTAPLPPEQADRIGRAAKSLRRLNSQMNGVSLLMLHWLEPLNAQTTKSAEAAVLAEARQKYGTCAAPPDLNKISHALQFAPSVR